MSKSYLEKGSNMELTSQNVSAIVQECLFTSDEIIDGKLVIDPLVAKGIVNTFGFHPERINRNKENIISLLDNLDDKFKEGWSFLNACVRKDGIQWGEHQDMEQLFCLGIAAGVVSHMSDGIPKEFLPGGMPYYRIV